MRITSILQLPPETLYRIFLELDSPHLLCKTLPSTCRTFKHVIHSRAITISANVELRSEEDDELGAYSALIQPPGPLKLLNRFRKTVVPLPPSPEASTVDNGDGSTTPLSASYSPNQPSNRGNESKSRPVVHIAAEREIRVHLAAITENPGSLVNYLTDLLRQGVHTLGSAKGKWNVKVVFGKVEIKGRRGRCSADLLGGFLGAMRPLKVILWHWDTELIKGIPGSVAPPMLRLPNMKSDSHVKRADLSLLSTLTSLERLELFRPLPRQPWGLEGSGFAFLSHLQNLRELIITPGRLIGGQIQLTDALMTLQNLQILELPWNIDARLAANLLQGLPCLTHFQFVNISSPDFWSWLRCHSHPSPTLNSSLTHLGLHYMQPDMGDLAILCESLIHRLPTLQSLTIRISKQNDSEYDFFAIPREFLERTLRRLEGRTMVRSVVLELGVRVWASRRNYVNELVEAFGGEGLRVGVTSPIGYR